MADLPTCLSQGCERLVHDQAYVCAECGRALARRLELVALLAGEPLVTIARLDRVQRHGTSRQAEDDGWHGGVSALRPSALPFATDAADAIATAANALTTWARHVAEERGIELPRVRLAPCRHGSCAAARARRRRVLGPACVGEPPEHPMAVAATWLVGQIEWLRHRPEASEAFGELHDAASLIVRTVDTAPEPAYWGPCECGAELRAPARARFIRCRQCGASWDAAVRRQWLADQAMDQLAYAAWIAAALTAFGHRVSDSTIRTWAERGRLLAHGVDANGRPLYCVGDVWDLVRDVERRQRIAALKAAVREAEREAEIAAA